MSTTVRLGDGSAIQFDPIQGKEGRTACGVLLTLQGRKHGELLNCCLIPLDRIGAVIESMLLVQRQLQP